MKRTIYLLVFLMAGIFFTAAAQYNWVGINSYEQAPADVRLVQSDIEQTQIQFSLDGYKETPLETPRGTQMVITVGEGVRIMEKGKPDLAKLVTTIIIPDMDDMEVNVTGYEYREFTGIEVAPSKGHFDRSINPDDVPFTYGEVYEKDAFWPGKLAQLEEPFIMRDFRGQTVTVFPFHYNPVSNTLRVYTDIEVEVTSTGKMGEDPLIRRRDEIVVEPEFGRIYERFFLNMEAAERSYPMLEGEEGSLLIICYDDFMEPMKPFVDWKRTIGRKTEIVPRSEAGNTWQQIKNYVENYYNENENFAHLLLIGDAQAQIPVAIGYYGGQSDNMYGFLEGTNSFNDIFVGRFSAETVAHVETQVQRMIEYERDIDETDTWVNTGLGIARNEGAGMGHHGESDIQHMNFIKDTLLNFTYDEVHSCYDGTGYSTSAAIITGHINDGVSAINFCNHGSVTGWSVANYNITHVNQLTNVGRLPYITSVACVNGAFVDQFCFAEAWLRATHNGEPTGAIGMMAATINQPWQPPMCGQDEMVSIKTEESIVHGSTIKRTYGGVSANGSMFMIPQYGGTGINTHETWILFGDPTLMVRTDVPTPFTADYPEQVMFGWNYFTVTSVDDGATVALTRIDTEGEVEIIGTAIAQGGIAEVPIEKELEVGEILTLAITGFNKVTYINDDITVIVDGPYANFTAEPTTVVIGETVTFTDASGGGEFSTWEWDFGEGAEPSTTTGQGPHEVIYHTPGKKTVSLLVDNQYEMVKEDYITVHDIVTLTVEINGEGHVEVDGTQYTEPMSLPENSTVSLEAIPATYWAFHEWTGDLSGTDNPKNLVMDGDKTVTANFTEASDATYTYGDIDTDRNFTGLPGSSGCPGTLTVSIPPDATITGVDVEYDMTAQAGGWMADQVSQLRCVSPGGADEPSVVTGTGTTGGTYSYSRTGLDIANGVTGGGDIVFELHAGRTWGGSGCNTTYNKVDNNTWKITVYYYTETEPYADFVGEPTTVAPGETVTFTDASGGGEFSTWEWNFGEDAEPATATGQGPHEVIYNTLGYKTVSLTVDGQYTETKEDYIYVTDEKEPLITFIVSDQFGDPVENAKISINHEREENHNVLSNEPLIKTDSKAYTSESTALVLEKSETDEIISPVYHISDRDGEWLRWDDGINQGNAVGLTSPGWWTGAIHFEPSDITDYDGWLVTEVTVYQQDPTMDGEPIIKIWQGPDINNLTEKVSQMFSDQLNQWHEIELEDPFNIDASQWLIFGIEWNDIGDGFFPHGLDDVGNYPNKGDAVILGVYPEPWDYLNVYGILGDWNMALYVEEDAYSIILYTDSDGIASFEAEPGDYVFNVEKEEHETFEGNFTVENEDKDIHVTLYKYVEHTLTLNADPEEGGTVDGEGEYYMGEEVEISAEANEGWEFVEWTGDIEHVDDPGSAIATVTMPDDDVTLTANFIQTPYNLALNADPEEGGTVDGEGEYYVGEEVEISAEANEGWEFIEWTGDTEHVENPNSATTSVTMPADDVTLTANFSQILYTLELNADPVEGGNVHGDGEYMEGETVEISAEPNKGWLFVEWTGDIEHVDDPGSAVATVTMPDDDVNLTAVFSQTPYNLALNADPEEGGTVDGEGEYYVGEEVAISAQANEGWEFVKWTGDTEHVENPNSAATSVTMPDDDVTLTANFYQILYTLALNADPVEGGNVHGDGEYEEGETVEISAEPNEGWLFVEWTGDTHYVADPEKAETTVTMPTDDITLIANFDTEPPQTYTLAIKAEPEEAGTVEGEGEYITGEKVDIKATPVDVDWEFENWSGDIDYVDDPESATTIVVMPDKDITLTANFKFVSVEDLAGVELSVFPNPARDKFYVESSEMIKHIRLIDISGQVVKDIHVDALNTEISVNNLKTGVYFMQIHTGETVITKRVQVAR